MNDAPLCGRIAVVGNAPDMAPCGPAIDSADHVIRFNHPAGFGGATGRRVDEVFVVNCGGQMRQWLDDDTLVSAPHIKAARLISLPIHPDVAGLFEAEPDQTTQPDPDGINYALEARGVLQDAGHAVRIVPVETFAQVCAALGLGKLAAGQPVPSTGTLALFDVLKRAAPDARVEAFGFGFDGWEGHDWAAERAWARSMAEAGRLVLHPV